MYSRLIKIASVIVILQGCSSLPQQSSKNLNKVSSNSNQLHMGDSESIANAYSSGFDKAVEGLPDKEVFKELLTNNSLWAVITPDGAMYSISSSNNPLLYLAIYDPTHPNLDQKGPTASMGLNNGRPIIILRPDAITQNFAGLVLIHELSHALDSINKTEAADDNVNELQAYLHQKIAANFVSNKKFDAALDRVLDENKIKESLEITKFIKENRSELGKSLEQIDKSLFVLPPASDVEAEMRLGFYIISLELKRQERTGSDYKSIDLGKVLNKISKY